VTRGSRSGTPDAPGSLGPPWRALPGVRRGFPGQFGFSRQVAKGGPGPGFKHPPPDRPGFLLSPVVEMPVSQTIPHARIVQCGVTLSRSGDQRIAAFARSTSSVRSGNSTFVTYMRRSRRVDALPANLTVSPTLTMSRGMRARSRSVGFWPSSSHSCATPSKRCVLISRRTCGFCHSTFVTSPCASTTVAESYSAVE